MFVSRLDVDVSGAAASGDRDVSTRLGLMAGGGLALMISKQDGLFGEYRFTRNRPGGARLTTFGSRST